MRAVYPERHTVIHQALVRGAEDEMGEPINDYAPPVEVKVYAWATPGADQMIRQLETGVKRDLDVYCSTPFAGPSDLVTVAGEVFKVEGHPEDYNHGPFNFLPGYRINLVRIEG